jgi:type II secretory pathway pseudopilin PulG
MKRRGFTLIATLITVAIICVLMVVMMQGYTGMMGGPTTTRKDGKGVTTMGNAMMTAQDQVCKSNLQQVRQAIEAARLSGDENPADIKGAGIGESFYRCPIGNEPYKYDPATGQVHCVHPGHENY